ncbi:uncharacterized protein LOC125222711 isoform X1 [Salvia hispanica]|uniref:uncharacterized protein LOC125222711 isoform X1 n=1 Tax=Salvia hispanica TaxID=49212 RepID=UPI00200947C5|nr:uncharacterized protein LOC125222711 isoform X1 [Salvia hispanica]
MTTISGSILNFSGIKRLENGAGYPKMLLHRHKCNTTRISKFHHGTASAGGRFQNLQKLWFHGCAAPVPTICAGRNYELDHNDDYHKEPFLLDMVKTVTWATQSLFQFLAEQPSQLRYIEWPSFQSTVKTAMLTLVLVALLIVALSTVDSALSYLLALFLRRKAW